MLAVAPATSGVARRGVLDYGVARTVSDASLQPILALLGYPVAANPTQFMMEKAIAHHRLDCRFLTLEVSPENLGDAVRGMRAMGFAGGTCAEPHKRAIVPHLNRLTEAAGLTGVVNCIVRDGNELVGENTEGKGMLAALARCVDPAGKRVVILGAGKVARAIAVELALAKAAQIVIVARNEPQAAELAALLREKVEVQAESAAWDEEYQVPTEASIVINATPIGQNDSEARVPLAVESLHRDLAVADVTFYPPETRLLADARRAGCVTIDGLEMFIRQAALDLQIWTGVEPDDTVMREAIEEFLLL